MAAFPRYQCHKQVGALKIAGIEINDPNGNYLLHFEEPGFEPIVMTWQWCAHHAPEIGGYLVDYDDGYRSYSPPEAFEAGYTRI